MSDLERELDHTSFCRIHRSAIVNLNRIRGLEVNEGGEYEVVLDGGTRLALSRRYQKQLQARLGFAVQVPPVAPRLQAGTLRMAGTGLFV